MIVLKNKEDCCGCHACFNVCSQKCINMERDSEGFLYPKIDDERCIKCQKCIKVCPIINVKTIDNCPSAFSCLNSQENIRLESTSGGLFSLLADNVIRVSGCVFGAEFDKDFQVQHNHIDTSETLYKLRGSKYLQSTIGDTYEKVKKFLMNGKKVLFTGTPCQIAGLNSFLEKDYDNLITQDIVCHGVPSPMVWDKYLFDRKKVANSKVNNVIFRKKIPNWKKHSILINFENGTKYQMVSSNDMFMKAFIGNLCLRPSCYNCKFKSIHRHSDITLADFWGVEHILPSMDDNKGISLVVVNTEKGKKIIDEIMKDTSIAEIDLNDAIRYNQPMVHSAPIPKERKQFMKRINHMSFDKAIAKYYSNSFYAKIIRKMKKYFRF